MGKRVLKDSLCLMIRKKVDENKNESRSWKCTFNGAKKCEVRCGVDGYSIDLTLISKSNFIHCSIIFYNGG